MKPEEKKELRKKKYQKPAVRIVALAAREVLAIGCKTSSAGPDFGNPVCTGGVCTVNDSS